MIRQPPKSPLFPSTTLFRSRDGAAVLTTEAQSLDQAKDQQQDARQRADLRVARHEADQGRRQAHAAERDQERVLPAHEVADPAEDEGPEWADQESGGEGADG